MSVKRIKVTDGVFVGERFVADLTKPLSADDGAFLRAALSAMGTSNRIARLEAFIAQCTDSSPPVTLRVNKMRDMLADAKSATADAQLAWIQAADLMRREIQALSATQKGLAFTHRKSKGRFGPTTRYLRALRLPNETARALWERLRRQGSGPNDDAPIYFDGDTMLETGSEKEISFAAFEKRLKGSKSR